MSQYTDHPMLTEKFAEALVYAEAKHHTQIRKGGEIPYVGHLLSVAGLVLEAGGDEDQAIAALLHDSAEDAGGEQTLAEVAAKFGDRVAGIVAECSDTFETPKPPWEQRKQAYIEHLRTAASDDAVLVSLADKLDNARALLRDFRSHGERLWERFTMKDPAAQLSYYHDLVSVFETRSDSWMVGELKATLGELNAKARP